MKRELRRRSKEWERENLVRNPERDDEKYNSYKTVKECAAKFFGKKNLSVVDNPEVAMKSHVVSAKITKGDFKIETEEEKKLFVEMIEKSDFVNIGSSAKGGNVLVSFLTENMYREKE